MKPVDEYLNQVLAQVNSLPPTVMPVAEALGATLAEDVFARFPVPPFTNSAMDGFAVRSGDLPNVLENTPIPAATQTEIPAEPVPAGAPRPAELPSAPGDDGAQKSLPLTLPVEADIGANTQIVCLLSGVLGWFSGLPSLCGCVGIRLDMPGCSRWLCPIVSGLVLVV